MGGEGQFKPGSALTFKTVTAIRSKLCKALLDETEEVFCIDLSEVEHCDSAGIALLLDARKLCKYNKKTLQLVGVSKETESLAEFCGVKGILGANRC